MPTFLLRNAASNVGHIYRVLRCDGKKSNIWSPVSKIQKEFDDLCLSPTSLTYTRLVCFGWEFSVMLKIYLNCNMGFD